VYVYIFLTLIVFFNSKISSFAFNKSCEDDSDEDNEEEGVDEAAVIAEVGMEES